jgi:hypothetical protein
VASDSVASAIPSGLLCSEPPKMTSSMRPPRRLLALCSPSTQVIASEMLLLPQPLGPTMAVMPPEAQGDRVDEGLEAGDLESLQLEHRGGSCLGFDRG